MHRLIPLLFATALFAGPVLAQDKPAEMPRLYQADKPVTISAAYGADTAVFSDPLTQVNEIGLQLRFTCAQADCDKAFFEFQLQAEHVQAAVLAFQTSGDALQPESMWFDEDIFASQQAFKITPKRNETIDVRIHWTSGARVTFDLYRTDPDTGATAMESHDVQLGGDVTKLMTRVWSGDLTIVKQTYRFR